MLDLIKLKAISKSNVNPGDDLQNMTNEKCVFCGQEPILARRLCKFCLNNAHLNPGCWRPNSLVETAVKHRKASLEWIRKHPGIRRGELHRDYHHRTNLEHDIETVVKSERPDDT